MWEGEAVRVETLLYYWFVVFLMVNMDITKQNFTLISNPKKNSRIDAHPKNYYPKNYFWNGFMHTFSRFFFWLNIRKSERPNFRPKCKALFENKKLQRGKTTARQKISKNVFSISSLRLTFATYLNPTSSVLISFPTKKIQNSSFLSIGHSEKFHSGLPWEMMPPIPWPPIPWPWRTRTIWFRRTAGTPF